MLTRSHCMPLPLRGTPDLVCTSILSDANTSRCAPDHPIRQRAPLMSHLLCIMWCAVLKIQRNQRNICWLSLYSVYTLCPHGFSFQCKVVYEINVTWGCSPARLSWGHVVNQCWVIRPGYIFVWPMLRHPTNVTRVVPQPLQPEHIYPTRVYNCRHWSTTFIRRAKELNSTLEFGVCYNGLAYWG